jgi:hypothetical protein
LATTIFEAAELDSDLLSALQDGSRGHKPVAREYGFSETSVRRWRTRHDVSLNTGAPEGPSTAATTTTADQVEQKGTIDVTPDGAKVNNVVVTSPINEDWSSVFSLFNMNADDFEVVDDTVRMSTWQQSKRTDDGERDTIQLFAYSARFRRISKDYVSPETVAEWREALLVNEPHPPQETLYSIPGTYVALVADPQLGKKGTEEAVENWKRGVTIHMQAAANLAPEAIHIAFQGDEHEGVVNNYANQPHTVELNFTRQLELDYDMRIWTIRKALELGIPLSVSSVISNHGEWTRNGGKDVVTTRSDNSSTHIARQVAKFFNEMVPFGIPPIDWTIGEGDPGVLVNLSGIPAYFSHGYIEKGKGGATEIRTKNALERQILGKTDTLGEVPLFFMAHYHHFYMQEFEGRTLFGCPALEAERSSEYMLDQYGVWSPPGMLGLLVGRDKKRGWSDLSVR